MAGLKSDKEWHYAIKKAVNEYHVEKGEDGEVKKTKYLNLLARRIVEAGIGGDVTALREIGDRLDGKPSQATELTVTVSIGDAMDDAQRRLESQYAQQPPIIDVTPDHDDADTD